MIKYNGGNKWLQRETDYLIKNYNHKSNKEIGMIIKKSRDAIAAKLCSLKLTRTNKKYISEIRNTQEGSIQRKKLFAEWDRMFMPPKIKNEIDVLMKHLARTAKLV